MNHDVSYTKDRSVFGPNSQGQAVPLGYQPNLSMDDSDRTTDLELYSEDLLIELVSGTRLEADVWTPKKPRNSQRGNKLAICLHPWSWFGGRKDDP